MSGSQRVFGSAESTGRKLNIIREYLGMYQKTLKSLDWPTTHYVDAFAGTGDIQMSEKDSLENGLSFLENADFAADLAQNFIQGSTKIALSIEPPFDHYHFIEKNKNKLRELEEKLSNHPHCRRVAYRCGDANEQIINFCRDLRTSDRAVIFLDPFGSQVNWETIEKIAATKSVDLWYLFPAGLSVFRQISKDGRVHKTHAPSLDRLYGTKAWREAFIEQVPSPTLFDHDATQNRKIVQPKMAADFMIARMKEVFQGGVADFKVPLGKKEHGYVSYYLLFAWSNPSKKAKALARKLSTAAVKASEGKHGWPH